MTKTKKPRRVVLTIEVETTETLARLRQAHSIYGSKCGWTIGRKTWNRNSINTIIQVSANEIGARKPKRRAAKGRK